MVGGFASEALLEEEEALETFGRSPFAEWIGLRRGRGVLRHRQSISQISFECSEWRVTDNGVGDQ